MACVKVLAKSYTKHFKNSSQNNSAGGGMLQPTNFHLKVHPTDVDNLMGGIAIIRLHLQKEKETGLDIFAYNSAQQC